MAKRLNWDRCHWIWRIGLQEIPLPDDLEKRAKAAFEEWKKTRPGKRFLDKVAVTIPKKSKTKPEKAKRGPISKKGQLGKLIKQVAEECAELDSQIEQVRRHLDLMADGPTKTKLEAKLESAIRGEGPEPRTPRVSWDSSQWLIEAEYQKSAARKYRRAGHLDKARKCETAAQKARKEGLRLRGQ